MFGAAVAAFALIRAAPGDPAEIMAGERGASLERLISQRQALGLDQPWWRQFAEYVAGVAGGDLGVSISTQTPVLTEFCALFPATFELTAAALILSLGLGVPLGFGAAARQGSLYDRIMSWICAVSAATPAFWLGLLLIWLFSLKLGWTPVSGRLAPALVVEPVTGFLVADAVIAGDMQALASALRHLILPALAAAAAPFALTLRTARALMIQILAEDYIRAARARGMSASRVLWRHAAPNAIGALSALTGLHVGSLLGGAVLTETIFGWPGVGKWLADAVARRDYPVLQGGVLATAALVTAVNIIADAVQRLLDPRISRNTRKGHG